MRDPAGKGEVFSHSTQPRMPGFSCPFPPTNGLNPVPFLPDPFLRTSRDRAFPKSYQLLTRPHHRFQETPHRERYRAAAQLRAIPSWHLFKPLQIIGAHRQLQLSAFTPNSLNFFMASLSASSLESAVIETQFPVGLPLTYL